MNSGEICHHAKMFMGAGEEKIAEMIQQEQPWKNGSEYQTTKCSAYQVEYKCITIVSGVERTGERR